MNELTDTPNILISGEWQAILFLGAFFVVNIAITSFLSSYFKKRGEDYAYKQVAADITKAVESIKSEFTEKIERLKSELICDIGRSQYLYEREYEILKNISTLVSEVELASIHFRSQKVVGSKISDKIFFELQDKIKETTDYMFKVRAFIPAEIIHEAMRYIELTNTHHMDIGLSEPDEIQEKKKHWMEADFNAVSESGKSLVESIRIRVNQWQKL